MTFLDNLQSHKGGLLRLKNQLYWYGRGGWDNNPGRICLLLDPAAVVTRGATCKAGDAALPAAHVATAAACAAVSAFLLIDGQPHWVWVVEEDVELLVNDPPAN